MSSSGNNNNNNEESSSRKGKGRRKVTMAKMENESNLQVTFSKRRNGLFKKASELSIRCGAETALVVFSPGDKPYSFGHPSVETVASRFLAGENDQNPTALEAERQMIANSTAELNQAVDELDLAKNNAKELDQMVGRIKHMKQCNLQQLDQLKEEVLQFQKKLENKDTIPGPNTNIVGLELPSNHPPPLGSSLQGLPNYQFPHSCYESNIFGNTTSTVASYDPFNFAGSDFPGPGYYNNPMWNASSSSCFVIPYSPIDPTENESGGTTRFAGTKSGGARE